MTTEISGCISSLARAPWVNLGKPSGVSSLGLALATGQDGSSEPLAYILGSDGNVWMKQLYKGNWLWINTGKPPAGVTVTAGIGATVSGGGRPMVFALGSDGNVWQDYWNGSHWGWTNLGHPGGVSVSIPAGALVNSGGNTMAFVVGSDANLWQLFWHDLNWSWNNLSRPASATPVKFVGAGSVVSSNSPYVYFEGSDNNVWGCFYSASANQGFEWFQQARTPFPSSAARPAGVAMAFFRPRTCSTPQLATSIAMGD